MDKAINALIKYIKSNKIATLQSETLFVDDFVFEDLYCVLAKRIEVNGRMFILHVPKYFIQFKVDGNFFSVEHDENRTSCKNKEIKK